MTSIDDFAFTRYLYSVIEVRQSLLMALLDRQRDEALFWVYELYFSSEGRPAFDYVAQIYEYLYKHHNPEFETFINNLLLEWEKDTELHHHIGTIVWNLCGRDYCVATFINEIIHIKAVPVSIEKPKTKLKIHLKPEDVVKYKTIVSDVGKARTVPAKACLYPTRKNVHNIFSTFVPENIQEVYSIQWEYYANRMPIWQNRFEDCDASFDDDAKTITFLEKNDDPDANQDQFYDHWGYEPDEQPVSVHEKWMGTGKEVQITMKEFANKYGANIPIKIRVNKKKPILENTIEISETTDK
jgi:hypothetical protein